MKTSCLTKFIPGIFLVTFLFSCSTKSEQQEQSLTSPRQSSQQAFTLSNGDTTWTIVDRMPVYKGGEKALRDYISRNISYPEEAKKAGIQGRVIARFRVGTDGRISMVSVLKGVDPLLDTETMRVVNTLAFEEPGFKGNRPVPVWYLLPVVYALK